MIHQFWYPQPCFQGQGGQEQKHFSWLIITDLWNSLQNKILYNSLNRCTNHVVKQTIRDKLLEGINTMKAYKSRGIHKLSNQLLNQSFSQTMWYNYHKQIALKFDPIRGRYQSTQNFQFPLLCFFTFLLKHYST